MNSVFVWIVVVCCSFLTFCDFCKKNATNTYRMRTGSVTSLAVEIVTILVSNNCCQSETAIVDRFFTANDATDPLDIFLLSPSAYSKNCLYTPTTFCLYFFIVNCRHKVGLWLGGLFIRTLSGI